MLDVIVDLNLTDKNIVVVGAGLEGTKRIATLLKYGCKIIVISEDVHKSIFEVEGGKYPLIIFRRKIHDMTFLNEFKDIFMVVAATNDSDLNKMVISKSKENHILTYGLDTTTTQLGDLSFTSTINIEESIQIAVSTFGKSPLMSKIIKTRIEESLKNIIRHEDILNIKIQEFARDQVKKTIKNQNERKRFLYALLNNPEIQELIAKKNIDKVKEIIINTLDKWEGNNIR
jgi:precorrin-2 dehydrogenase/sirohydrochlorin ferrochelatase